MDSRITLMEFDPANFPKVQAAATAGVPGAAEDLAYYADFMATAAQGDSNCPVCAEAIKTLGLILTGKCREAGKGRRPEHHFSLMICAACVASRSRTEIIRSWLDAMAEINGIPTRRTAIILTT